MNEQEFKFQQQIQQLDFLIRQKMTRDALGRYGNIKTAHPEKTFALLVMFAQLNQTKPIDTIDDSLLKEWLMALNQKRQTTIKRK